MRTSSFHVGRCLAMVLAAVLSVTLVSPYPAFGQSSKSAAVAKELAQALDAAKLDAIAAPDPSDPSIFVAALYFQGSQLLVVSAKYAAPPLLVEKIKSKNYRDVYIDLSSASVAGSKSFVMDIGADGLSPKPGDAGPDSWEKGTQQVAFDGDWKKAKLSEEQYMKSYSEADEQYTKMLSLLLAQAKGKGSA
jgi:hypothetical protein